MVLVYSCYFGLFLGGLSLDAIYPLLYPDLLPSKQFLVSLFTVNVKTADGTIDCDLHTYLTKYQKGPFYEYPKNWVKRKIKEWKNSKKPVVANSGEVNPFRLSESDMILTEMLESMIRCSVNKKTDVISISVRTQDPLVSAMLADSVSTRLQTVIQNSKAEYESAVENFSRYCDAHGKAVRQSYISEQNRLENEMNMRYETYQTMHAQLQAASSKLQERTPAFTTLQCSTVPVKPAGPKRLIFVLAMLILSAGCTILYIGQEEFKKVFAAH